MAHHKLTGGNLMEAGRLQIPLTSFYIGIEPSVIRLLDKTTRFFVKVKGRPVLAILSRLLGRLLPTGEVITYEQATDFIDAISVLENTEITVGPCICQKALGKRNGTYVKDLFVLYGAEAFRRADDDHRDLTPEEAKALLHDLHEEGLVPSFFACMHSKGWAYVLCHCEKEICFPMRAHLAAGGVFSPGTDIVTLDKDKCTGCGICVDSCHFGANSMVNGTSAVSLVKCYGCGLCTSSCTGEARTMIKRKDYRNQYYPIELVGKGSISTITS